jgi:hypothetical protein
LLALKTIGIAKKKKDDEISGIIAGWALRDFDPWAEPKEDGEEKDPSVEEETFRKQLTKKLTRKQTILKRRKGAVNQKQNLLAARKTLEAKQSILEAKRIEILNTADNLVSDDKLGSKSRLESRDKLISVTRREPLSAIMETELDLNETELDESEPELQPEPLVKSDESKPSLGSKPSLESHDAPTEPDRPDLEISPPPTTTLLPSLANQTS